MNDVIYHNPGVTDLTIVAWLQNVATGDLITGVDVTDLDYKYLRVLDDNDVTISGAGNISLLASLTSNHSSGGMIEIGEGAYRFDVPDFATAGGASMVDMIIWDAAANTIMKLIQRIQMNMVKILKPDWYVDTAQSPWEIVYHCPGDITKEYKRAQLRSTTGASIVSTGVPIGAHINV